VVVAVIGACDRERAVKGSDDQKFRFICKRRTSPMPPCSAGSALLAALKNLAYHFKRIGLEAGPLSQWLFSALAEAELPVICVETRHMQAVLKVQINKTDRNDARGIAQMMRAGLYRPVHVSSTSSSNPMMEGPLVPIPKRSTSP
jgi:hypothetical protein